MIVVSATSHHDSLVRGTETETEIDVFHLCLFHLGCHQHYPTFAVLVLEILNPPEVDLRFPSSSFYVWKGRQEVE